MEENAAMVDNQDNATICDNGGSGAEHIDVLIEAHSHQPDNGARKNRKALQRHRMFHTICLFGSAFAMGWRIGLLGPTFPDLRLVIDEDLSTASWIFTGMALGSLAGSLCGGIAYDRLNKIWLFGIVSFGLGVTTAVIPWCSNFAAMLAAHVVNGALLTIISICVTADIVLVWRHKAAPFMQALTAMFSIGAIMSPLVTEPFLAKKITRTELDITIANTVNSDDLNFNFTIPDSDPASFTVPANITSNTTIDVSKRYGETRVFVTYCISAAICLASCLFYTIVPGVYGSLYDKNLEPRGNIDCIKKTQYFLSKRLKNMFTVFLVITLALYSVAEGAMFQFLMTFLVSHLAWTKAEGANASATFWITFSVGRIVSIFVVKSLHLSIVLIVFEGLLLIGGILFWIAVVFNIEWLVWVSVGLIGFGMAPIFGCVFTWLSDNIRRLTGKMASIFSLFNATVSMVFPIVLGYLMDRKTQMWFIYFEVLVYIAILVCTIFFTTLYTVLEKRSKVLEESETKECLK